MKRHYLVLLVIFFHILVFSFVKSSSLNNQNNKIKVLTFESKIINEDKSIVKKKNNETNNKNLQNVSLKKIANKKPTIKRNKPIVKKNTNVTIKKSDSFEIDDSYYLDKINDKDIDFLDSEKYHDDEIRKFFLERFKLPTPGYAVIKIIVDTKKEVKDIKLLAASCIENKEYINNMIRELKTSKYIINIVNDSIIVKLFG